MGTGHGSFPAVTLTAQFGLWAQGHPQPLTPLPGCASASRQFLCSPFPDISHLSNSRSRDNSHVTQDTLASRVGHGRGLPGPCTPSSNTGHLHPSFQHWQPVPQLPTCPCTPTAHASTLKVKWRFGAYKLTQNTNPDTGVPVLQLSAIHPMETNLKGQ